MQLTASAPGTGKGRPFCAPIAQNTASYAAFSWSMEMSLPTRTPVFTVTPSSEVMRPISASSMSRGVR